MIDVLPLPDVGVEDVVQVVPIIDIIADHVVPVIDVIVAKSQ